MTSAVVETGGRPLRRDAEINLARILVAARDVFAEHGYDASMEQIAARANVGIGTLYRRFPNKAELVNAVVEAASQRTQQIAEAVLAESTPADGVFEFLRRCIAAPSCWRVIASRTPWTDDTTTSALARVAPLVERLLADARRAGTVAPDVTFTDLMLVLMSVRAVADLFDPFVASGARRFLEVAMGGLRPGAASLYSAPVTMGELSAVLTGGGNDSRGG